MAMRESDGDLSDGKRQDRNHGNQSQRGENGLPKGDHHREKERFTRKTPGVFLYHEGTVAKKVIDDIRPPLFGAQGRYTRII
jgi:hypothetical protein